MKTLIPNLKELKPFAEAFLKQFPKGAVVGLSGELGSGKTTFVRMIVELLAERSKVKIDRVISPSFVLHQSYPQLKPPVDHFDLYRMDAVTVEMLIELQYYDVLDHASEKGGYVFVEWPEQCRDKTILKMECEIQIELQGVVRAFTLL